MDWLAKNAAAIQAIGAIVGALTTVALAYITYSYVRLTGKIAESSTEQVRLIREAAKATQLITVRTVATVAARIRNSLAKLDSDSPRNEQLYAFTEVNEGDITHLETLTWQVGDSARLAAGSAATVALREVFETIKWTKDTESKYSPSPVRIEHWKRAKEESDRRLHAIETECQNIVGNQ